MALATQQSPNTQTQTTVRQTAQTPSGTAYRYIAAWTLLIAALMLLNRTAVGHTAIYYTLVMMIVFLLITQYHAIVSILSPFQTMSVSPEQAMQQAGAAAGGAIKGGS